MCLHNPPPDSFHEWDCNYSAWVKHKNNESFKNPSCFTCYWWNVHINLEACHHNFSRQTCGSSNTGSRRVTPESVRLLMLRSSSLRCDGLDFIADDNAEHPLAVILQSDRLKIIKANNHELHFYLIHSMWHFLRIRLSSNSIMLLSCGLCVTLLD